MTSKLVFNKPIISTVAKPIPVRELLTRLQALSDELSAVDQDNVDLDSFKNIATDLANKKLLKHSNLGVQAYTCCCISDILRIYAPDAPFTAPQLSTIFQAFFGQLKYLVEKENPYFLQQNYLLKRLAEVRSIILVTDLPNAETLVQQMFHMLYDLATKDFPIKLEPLVSDMLSEVIAESETIPHDVLKLILEKFLSTNESSSLTSSSNSNISNPGLEFSLHICEANVHKMSRQVTQYFSEMLNECISQDMNQEESSEISDKAMKTLEKIHRLSVQIWKSVPQLLGSVMGLINDELNTDNEKIRILAIVTIGEMVGSSSSSGDNALSFAMAHKNTWLNWLKKTMDVSPNARAKWVEQLSDILHHTSSVTSGISTELRNGLIKCLLDTNDKVRFTACRTIDRLEFETFTSVICNKLVLTTLFQLMREKNADIRNRSIKILSQVYNQYNIDVSNNNVINFGNTEEDDIAELENLISEGIPNHILELNYINDTNITTTVDVTIFEKLLPFENNSIKRVDRLCQLYSSLNDKSKASFNAICKRQQKQADVLNQYIKFAEEYCKPTSSDDKENVSSNGKNSGELPKSAAFNKLEKIMKWLSVSFPEGLNTYACLERFVKLKNYRFFHLVKFCISPESDYKTIKNSLKELLGKIGDVKNIKLESDRAHITPADMVSNFKILLYRASTIFYNKANVAELINLSKNSTNEWFPVANEILENISSTVPDVFKVHVDSLVDLIIKTNEKPDGKSFSTKSNNLRTVYHILRKFPELLPKDPEFIKVLKQTATSGLPRETRYAIKLLGLSPRKELYTSEIVTSILPLDVSSKNFACHISALAELYIVDTLAVTDHEDAINTLLIEQVLRSNRFSSAQEVDLEDDSWIEDINLDYDFEEYKPLYEKLLTIRLITNRLKSLVNKSNYSENLSDEQIISAASKPLKLLSLIVSHGGELINSSSSPKTPKSYQQKLRLQAGFCILKLAKYPKFQKLLTHNITSKLGGLLHDECEQIRSAFSKKLEVNLWNNSITDAFLPLLFLMGHEPNSSLKKEVSSWIQSGHKRCVEKKDIKFERILVRLIHTISHDSNFINYFNEESPLKAYTYASEYFVFFLKLIGKQDNISLLYYLASRVKQYRDATIDQTLFSKEEYPEEVLNLYRISELAQLAIQVLNDCKHWSIQTWPGKINLPSDIYAPMDSYEEAQKIISTVYIKDTVQIELKQHLKRKFSMATKKKISTDTPKKRDAPKRKVSEIETSKRERIKSNARKEKAMKPEKKKRKTLEEPSRKSSRSTKKIVYTENSDSDETSMSEYSEDED